MQDGSDPYDPQDEKRHRAAAVECSTHTRNSEGSLPAELIPAGRPGRSVFFPVGGVSVQPQSTLPDSTIARNCVVPGTDLRRAPERGGSDLGREAPLPMCDDSASPQVH